ncbi:MAG: hypothetical protein KKE93_03945 [Nanoarchaeota archaeon]|nr:hypothetical protein [Nanoarchaeota archaeon]
MSQMLIHKLVRMEDIVVPTLFKPVQFNVLKKLDTGMKLTENEKRYLRGKMRDKLNMLAGFTSCREERMSYLMFLDNLESYYITGLEALKHNGFGWYFKPKIIEIINTKIEGKVNIPNKTLKFIRVKSIKNSKFSLDKKTGLKYAANEQIIKDVKITKNEYAEKVWKQMISRYGKLFIKNCNRFKSYIQKPKMIDYTKYGV